jgi:glutamate racemase
MHIGLFDSGVGGLTVLKELKNQMPHCRFSYLGDTARLPYGNKAPDTLKKYTLENIDFLDSLNVDVIVIACHSASSVSLDLVKSKKSTPIYNVIIPSCAQAIEKSKNLKIGIIATKATIKSLVYTKQIEQLQAKAQVFSQACPLLVPLVEEGYIDDDITRQILHRYLDPMLKQGVETLILGCTHYPILRDEIANICGKNVVLIDPAQSVAQQIRSFDKNHDHKPQLEIYLTDHAGHFVDHAQRLLNSQEPLTILYPNQ